MINIKDKLLPEDTDLKAFILTEQISRDYLDTIRTEVAPDIIEDFGIRLREIRILMCLGLSSNHYMSATEVANILRLDRATVTRSSIILIGKNYIHTTPNLEDSRVKNLYLTEKGHEISLLCRTKFVDAVRLIESFGDLDESILKKPKSITVLKKIEKRARSILYYSYRMKKLRR